MSMHDSKESGDLQRVYEAALFGTGGRARVLVADDDPITGQLLAAIGETEGYQVVSVDDGRQAYRMLKSDADFTAAVFNMTMPHLKGVDIVRYMKTEKRLKRIPVVLIAGDDGLKLIAESFAAGALVFLPKPFTREKLARAIRLAIDSRAARQRTEERLRKLAA
jgi:DNA-binding NtrC family response regulator